MKTEKIVEVVRIYQEIKERDGILKDQIKSPDDLARLARHYIGDEDREVFLVIGVNTQNYVNVVHRAHVGSLSSSIVTPREVFKPLILNNCASFAVSHNHPSSITAPSPEDIEITRRLADAGELLGIRLLDHVIVGNAWEYTSLKQQNRF